jgi:3-dehydroquinate synthase
MHMAASLISVELPQQSYNVAIAPGGLETIGAWVSEQVLPHYRLSQRLVLVSNPQIFKHYGDRVVASLTDAGFEVSVCILPAGERYKTLNSIQKIYDAALAHRLERSAAIVALGGGVIGDMAGFAAATWLRGVHFIQLPTSLLAMVDASIGGKTGVNHPQGKNLIGAFHQPRLVLIDPQVLTTLPAREFRAGMAEVIKYGIIWDVNLFEQLEAAQRLDQRRYVSDALLQMILAKSCQAKAHVVSKDEKEAGLRAILNYGHTIGHAVESLTGYRRVNHGEAVAIGMVAAGHIAREMAMWTSAECDRQTALLEKTGLPTAIPAGLDLDAILDSLKSDKKVKDGKVRFVLPQHIGSVTVTDQVSPQVVRTVLDRLQAIR